jgi:hypothetical protein
LTLRPECAEKGRVRAFKKSGYLRHASREAKFTYTWFLLLTALGTLSMIALSAGRVGLNPSDIATYYRGGDDELSFPRTFWQLVEVSHFHLFSVPVVLLVLTHLLFGTGATSWIRMGFTASSYVGALLQLVGPWAIRYGSAHFAWMLLLGWLLLTGSMLLLIGVSLAAAWGSRRDLTLAQEQDLPE